MWSFLTYFEKAFLSAKRRSPTPLPFRCHVVNPDISDEAIEELIESKDPQAFMKDQMMGPSAQVLDRVVEIEERHEGILRIEQGVKEIQVP